MSALAHYFETAGIPTTLSALVREHAEAMHPPRALAVPFELGRPLGAPEDAAFQRRVITAALALLERPSGPVLEDYPEDAPADAAASEADEGWACPVSFAQPKADAPITFAARLQAEVAQMKPWHEAWKRRKGFSRRWCCRCGSRGAGGLSWPVRRWRGCLSACCCRSTGRLA